MAYGDKTKTPFSLSPITVSGCTDPAALNYNKNATKDDGSCTYASMDPHLTKTVMEVGMEATLEDGWYFASPQWEYLLPDLNNPYEGPYHLMEDGTYMIGVGALNASHEINPNEIIIQDYSAASTYGLPDLDPELDPIEGEFKLPPDYETIQGVREVVSDLFYKLWFSKNTLTDEQVLSLQTTIRDGKKQTAGKTGRAEGEPLVFYKKDRNTLENREDLQSHNFEQICQDIYDNSITNLEGKFDLLVLPEIDYNNEEYPPKRGYEYWKLQQHVMRYTKDNQTTIDVIIAEEAILYRRVKETTHESSDELVDVSTDPEDAGEEQQGGFA